MLLLSSPTLTWLNVLLGLLFILFDAVLSLILGLGIGTSLVVASIRSIVQLTIMGLVLDKVFASDNIWGVVGIACGYSLLLNLDVASLCCSRTSELHKDDDEGSDRSVTERPGRFRGNVQ